MSVPITLQLFDAFLGSAEGIHSILLPDVFSSGGSKNLWIDKYGRAKKISGYAKQNASAVTTDTGASATLVRGLFPYRKTSGGSVTRQLVGVFDDGVNEWEIHTSTNDGATWTFRSDLGATAITQIPDFAQFGDNLYVTSGKVAPKKWDGSSLGATGRTQSPTPTATASSSSGNLSGTYTYKLVSRKSDGSRGAGSVSSGVVTVTTKKIDLSWTADADLTVDGYEVYRTTATGNIFYFVDFVDGRTTVAFTDNVEDLNILENRTLDEHGDAPPTVYFCEPHKQRMWWGRSDTYPTRVWWSDPGLAEDVYTNNYLDFSDSETMGDFVTGMLGNFEGRLIVFTERAIWSVSGTGGVIGNIVDWTRIRTNTQTGCVSHRAAVRVPAGAKYTDQNGKVQLTSIASIAYFTPLADIRVFDGDNDIIISHPVKDKVKTLNYAQRAKIFAIPDTERNEITWVFPGGSAGEPSTAVTWNWLWGVWYEREWGFSCGIETENSSDSAFLLAGSNSTTTGGYVFQLWSGNTFNGSNIEAIWMTKTLYGANEQGQPAISNTKRWRWADFLFQTEQTVTLTIEWMAGNSPNTASSLGSTTVSPASASILTADGDTIVTADGDTIILASDSTQARAILKNSSGDYLHDEGVRLKVGDNASNGSWSLEGFNLAYQRLPGLQRRMQS